jgi:hypothetical protein
MRVSLIETGSLFMFKTCGCDYCTGMILFHNLAPKSTIALRHAAYKEDHLRRTNRLTLMLNDREIKALSVYCSRYRVKSKSEFCRETIMKAIIKRFEEEHPTLWEDFDATLFNQEISK